MRVILDSNNFVERDYRLKGSSLHVLAASRDYTYHSIYIPQVVVDELVSNFGDDLRSAMGLLKKGHRELKKLGHGDQNSVADETQVDSWVREYKVHLTKRASDLGLAILPYPEVTLPEVVQRVLEQRRPFKNREEGFRDTLIWETVLQIARSSDEGIAFVTADGGFWGKSGLHPDLIQDLRKHSIDESFVQIFRDISTFNESYVEDLRRIEPESLDDLLFELQMGEHRWLETWETALDQIEEKLLRHPRALELIDVPDSTVEVYLWAVDERLSSDIVSVAGLKNGEFLLLGWVEVACSAEYDVPHDYLPWEVDETQLSLGLRVDVEFTLDPQSGEMTSSPEITAVSKLWQREH